MHGLGFLTDLLILFGLSVAVVLLFHRVRIPPIVGFLITGVLSGPYGLGLIRKPGEVESLAEVGVILLLFTIGLEFSLAELLRLRTFLFTGGALQVGLTLVSTAGIAHLLGASWPLAVFLGMLVSLSSTAIVLRLLGERGELDAPPGQAALGILIFQDLCIVPMVLIVPRLGGAAPAPGGVGVALARAIGFVVVAVLAAKLVVPRVLRAAVSTRRREIFLLTVILICLAAAWASERVGLSLALGAFLAGLTVSESEYSHQALGEVLPLREVFNSLFFVSVGMLFDVRVLLDQPWLVVAALGGVVLLKTVVTTAVTAVLGQSVRSALVTGLSLAQIGEFSFVLSQVGSESGLLDHGLDQLFLAVAVGSMALTPLLIAAAPHLAARAGAMLPSRWVVRRFGLDALPTGDAPREDHCIVVGFGFNGRNLARVLGGAGIPFVAIEMNPEVVREERRRGHEIIYGDATRPEVLEHAGLARARVLVVAISDAAATRSVVALARRLNPGIHIIVRTRYIQEMQPLLALGTSEVIPEEFETAVEIFARVLARYLVPRDEIQRAVDQVRSDGYGMLRTLAEPSRAAPDVATLLPGVTFEVVRVQAGAPLAGRSLAALRVRDATGASAVALQRAAGELVVNPSGREPIAAGDALLLIGGPEQISRAAALCEPETA